MQKTASRFELLFTPRRVLGVGCLLAIFLLIRNEGLYPTVFADELHYSLLSRLNAISEANDPDYLYLGLFRITNYCGDNFLGCARILNVAVFMLGVYFVYRSARTVVSSGVAGMVALGTILLPTNVYTAYFMPEAMYFGMFWLLTWFALAFPVEKRFNYSVGCGALIALLGLVKPHAFFLVPAVGCFAAYRYSLSLQTGRLRQAVTVIVLVVVSAVAVRLALGGLIAGPAGLSIFGHRYNAMAAGSQSSRGVGAMIVDTLKVFGRHALALAFMFGVPFAIAIGRLRVSSFTSRDKTDGQLSVVLYLTLVLGVLLAITSVFTVSVDGTNPYDVLDRVHMRYYNFAFPLFFMVAASGLSNEDRVGRKWRSVIAGALALLIVVALLKLPHISRLVIVDGPEITAASHSVALYWLYGIAGLVALSAWARVEDSGARIFVFVFCPVFLVGTSCSLNNEMRARLHADSFDEAGIFAHRYLSRADMAELVVFGTDISSLYRTMFYLDTVSARLVELAPGAPMTPDVVPDNTGWVLTIGSHGDVPESAIRSRNGDYALYRARSVSFSQSPWPAVIVDMEGLAKPTGDGARVLADEATIRFKEPLPRHFVIRLKADASGALATGEFTIEAGGNVKTFKLTGQPASVTVPFESVERGNTLKIRLPQRIADSGATGNAGNGQAGEVRLISLQVIPTSGN
ncbi:DUF7024 domain-containing protein [Paraburkholderia terrae]|uniref:DUF7024 domain-containing protein n=1 Tax=Paraburkholderia terrae TaxID=311230 RepID=UPI001E59E432|nr:hypothetical protein [Paraburkholderia terrae]